MSALQLPQQCQYHHGGQLALKSESEMLKNRNSARNRSTNQRQAGRAWFDLRDVPDADLLEAPKERILHVLTR